MKNLFLFLFLSLVLFLFSCEKESNFLGEDKEYNLSGDMQISFMEKSKESLSYLRIDGIEEQLYINNYPGQTYRRGDSYDSRYHLKWDNNDSIVYIYHHRPDYYGDWYRVNIYTIFGKTKDIKDLKEIFDYHKVFEDRN